MWSECCSPTHILCIPQKCRIYNSHDNDTVNLNRAADFAISRHVSMPGWLIIVSVFSFFLHFLCPKVNENWIAISFGLEANWNGFWKVSAKLEPTPPYLGGLVREVNTEKKAQRCWSFGLGCKLLFMVSGCSGWKAIIFIRQGIFKGFSRRNIKKALSCPFFKVIPHICIAHPFCA